MMSKLLLVLGMIFLVVFISGCIGEEPTTPAGPAGSACPLPKKLINNVYCDDANNNNVCDMDEGGCPASCDDNNACTNEACSISTNFRCNYTVMTPCCGNGICEASEDVANVCPQDCSVLDMTDFQYSGTPDYIEDKTFVFIHTTASEAAMRLFTLNITAPFNDTLENVRYTYK